LLESPNRIAFVGDAIVGKLCGCRAHDPTSLSIAMLYNPWLERSDPEILDKIGIDDAQLPCLMPATAMAGTLQKDIAEDLGLPADIPVSPAVHDQYAASLGAASVSEGDVNFGAGTAWVLLANSAKLATPVTPDAFVCRHPVDGLFGQMLSMLNGGSAIHWAMNLTGSRENDVQSVEDILENTTPGADGLRCWPFLAGAPRGKDGLAMKGRLSGISLAHDRSHLLRAVVEGLACELRRHIEQLAEGGISLRRLVMCGSAASGRHTPRIIAEVTGLPVSCVETPDISALGAAMLARSLVNRNIALADIARAWEPPKRTVQSSENAAIYRDLYSEYLSVVEANKNS
jgi:sugar (pentulose or hexulose) kinase